AGDGVKNLEPIMQLVSMSKLRAEGAVEGQYFNQLAKGMRVVLEPSQEVGAQPLLKVHSGEITGVAVCADNKHFVTGSEDKNVCVWQRGRGEPLHFLLPPHPVRSVACSPKGFAKSLCLVGCSDGSVYLWDLDNVKKPVAVLKDHHRDAVTAVAFSH